MRATFGAVEEIVSGPTLGGLRLLRACLDEAMRLSPPVPALLPRAVLPGGMTICGENIPAGTVVGTPQYTLQRNPAYYADPLVYRPERWVPADGEPGAEAELRIKRAQSAFAPFSLGSRGCVGKSLAYRELTIAVARLLWLYDLRLAPGLEAVGVAHDGTYALRDIFVADKHGPFVQFRRREGAQTS